MRNMKALFSCALLALCGYSLVACADWDFGKSEVKSDNSSKSDIPKDYVVSTRDIVTANISSGVSVHDPSILEADGAYYIFGSHMSAAKSDDLKNWKTVSDGYMKNNPVYGQVYDVADEAFAYSGSKNSLIVTDDKTTHVWAPDVIYNKKMKKYCMYYCMTSTWNASNLCFGISDNPEGPYVWQSALLYSGFNNSTLDGTNVLEVVEESYAKKHYIKGGAYNFEDYPNAIDPSVFYDKDGKMWMVYGSWSGGIYLLEIDESTGNIIFPEGNEEKRVDPYFGKKLIGGGHISIEGPYIIYDSESDYYYLYVSYGALTSNGGYQIRAFRSKTVDGDYVDMKGEYPEKSSIHQNFGLKLSGNYKLPSLEKAYMATGHNSALIASDKRKYIIFHTRFNDSGEGHSPRVHQMLLNKEGWPCMLPYQTQNELVEENGYSEGQMIGRYYVINQGTAINNEIANPVIIYLNADGSLEGREVSGSWSKTENTYYMRLVVDDKEYSGVFCAMLDEAGTECMVFSAVGENESLWGVKYVGEVLENE